MIIVTIIDHCVILYTSVGTMFQYSVPVFLKLLFLFFTHARWVFYGTPPPPPQHNGCSEALRMTFLTIMPRTVKIKSKKKIFLPLHCCKNIFKEILLHNLYIDFIQIFPLVPHFLSLFTSCEKLFPVFS